MKFNFTCDFTGLYYVFNDPPTDLRFWKSLPGKFQSRQPIIRSTSSLVLHVGYFGSLNPMVIWPTTPR